MGYPLTDKTKIGRLIYSLRTFQGMTQKRLADAVGLDECYISLIENGKKGFSMEHLEPICNELGVKLSEFFRMLEKGYSIRAND